MLHSSDRPGERAVVAAAPKNVRFAKFDKDALVCFTGRNSRLNVRQLAGVSFLFLKLWRTAKRQGHYFQWRTGIALAYRERRRSFFLFGLHRQNSMKIC